MKRLALLILSISFGLIAAERPLTLPTGAKEVAPNVWSWTDEKGKAWTFRRTPFSLVKIEGAPETGRVVDACDEEAAGISAFDQGDSIRFERHTPFGKRVWTSGKSNLTDLEKAAWSRAQAGKAQGKAETKEQ